MTTKLAQQTQKVAGIPNGMRTATIAAVSGSAVTISVAGGSFSSGVGVVGSYVPVVGDTVAVFRQDSSWLVLGDVSAIGGTGSRRVGTASGQADGSATSSTTESVYETVTVNVITGRTYHVKSYFPFVASASPARYLVRLREGTSTAGAQITYATAIPDVTLPGSAVLVVSPESDWSASSTGSQSFCVTVQQVTGTGALTPKGASSQPRLLTVDLIEGA